MEKQTNNALKIDLFLKEIQLLSQMHNVTSSQIYAQLTNIKIPHNEIRTKLSDSFSELQYYYRSNKKMNAFVAPNWNYFCQFISEDSNEIYGMNPIKIYIPLKKENIEKNVQKIFDFINKNKIKHVSKLASEVRVDDLVIRVSNEKDANKIIEFVNKDKGLLNDTYEQNPFCISEGKVGLAMDRMLSYNSTLSKYIFEYIKEISSRNIIADHTSFKNFMYKQLKQIQNKGNLSTAIKMCVERENEYLPNLLQSVEEITKVIIMTLEGKNKEDLYKYFKEINTQEYNEKKIKEYEECDYRKSQEYDYKIFKLVFRTMENKYGYNRAKESMEIYKNTGNSDFITRTNNARDLVERSKTFRTYLNMIDLEKEMQNLHQKTTAHVQTEKEKILEEVCKSTYEACQTEERDYCGKNQVAIALINMEYYNNYNSVTRLHNAREIAKKNLKPEELKKIIKDTLEANGYIIENEEELYELYASHIEYICNNKEKEDNHARN